LQKEDDVYFYLPDIFHHMIPFLRFGQEFGQSGMKIARKPSQRVKH